MSCILHKNSLDKKSVHHFKYSLISLLKKIKKKTFFATVTVEKLRVLKIIIVHIYKKY